MIKEEVKELDKLSNDFMIIDEEDAKFVIKQLIGDQEVLAEKAYEYVQGLKIYQIDKGELDESLLTHFMNPNLPYVFINQ